MKKTETTNFFMKNKISDFIYDIRVKNYQRKLKKGKINEKEISSQSKGEIIQVLLGVLTYVIMPNGYLYILKRELITVFLAPIISKIQK